MGRDSAIEWTDHTINYWRGCTAVSAGCKNCYAEVYAERFPKIGGVWGRHGTRVVVGDKYLSQLYHWDGDAAKSGRPALVFANSLSDFFEGYDTMPESSWLSVSVMRQRAYKLMTDTPHLIHLLLTKRPENIAEMVPDGWNQGSWPKNIWVGTSIEDAHVEHRLFEIGKINAAGRYLSIEPLLGPLKIDSRLLLAHRIDWVIVGGESGPHSRPMSPEWVRNIRDACIDAGVPFHFKQWGGVNKKAAGAELDGREWRQFPQAFRRGTVGASK